MRNYKRIMALCLSAVLAVSVVGCSSDENSTETPKTEEATPKTQQSTKPTEEQKEVTELKYGLEVDADQSKLDESSEISDILYGIFVEDINHTVDGGMYAEMIKNGSFEYGEKANNKEKHGWENAKDKFSFEVKDGSSDKSYLNENNTHYAVLKNSSSDMQGIGNSGYLKGLAVTKDAKYKATLFLKGVDQYAGKVTVSLEDSKGTVYGAGTIDKITSDWWKYEVELTAKETKNSDLKLYVKIDKGTVQVDSVSLFPVETYKNRENGIRKDIGEYLESLNPKFLRFPGGCLIEGKTLEDAYNWKQSIGYGLEWEVNGEKTVGDVAARSYDVNIWHKSLYDPYYMTYGMGFYEFFLLCEDLDCLPVPVVNAGMTCPIQSENYYSLGLNSEELEQYIQDALDLIEFCRGGADTKWGAVRIAMGHKEKFPLKYVGIGNEQWQTEYYMHYNKFLQALEEAKKENPEIYGDIEFIVANGPNSGDTFAWDMIQKKSDKLAYAGLVDEHYYQTPQWFLENVNRYDSYDRESVPVFLGEYAAKSNTMQAALAEAAYLTGVERNADIVKMACYAPLFANDKENQWEPDMIWYANDSVYGSVNYYVQKMFANNVGTNILPSTLDNRTEGSANTLKGKVGIGTWQTSAKFDDLQIVSNVNQETLYSADFESDTIADWSVQGGQFAVEDGVMVQKSTTAPKNQNIGDVAYVGDAGWSDYTLKVKATKTGGDEGFLIPIAVQDADNCVFWNIGGWGNTISCIQTVTEGVKSDQIAGTVKNVTLQTNKEYEIEVIVKPGMIKGYLDGELMFTYTPVETSEVFQTASIAENGDIIIKIVNVSGIKATVDVAIKNGKKLQKTAKVTTLSAKGNDVKNTKTKLEVQDEESTLEVSEQFTYEASPYSVNVIRISQEK